MIEQIDLQVAGGPIDELFKRYSEGLKKGTEFVRKVSSGRGMIRKEMFLVEIVRDLRHLTSRPHYTKLAYILTAAYAAWGKLHVDVDPNSLQHIVDRFRKNHPSVWNLRPLHQEIAIADSEMTHSNLQPSG